MAETRIALIMGGGVSLGTFSGGAMAEVIRLLKHVKRGPAKIDVVSGASAGSMTLGIVVYHLMKGSSDQEIEDALHKAWVKCISMDNLYPKDISSHKQASLFSNKIIHKIARNIIDTNESPINDKPHPLFAEGMKVSFSLTNLNGIPVRSDGQIIRQKSTGGGETTGRDSVFADAVQTTFHQDNIRFVVRRKSVPGSNNDFEGRYHLLKPWEPEQENDKWDIFRSGAIASGAFPVAFPPERILRESHEFGKWWPDELKDRKRFMFDYLDGGILRNEPLREAIHMAGEQDNGQDVERVFIFIDPNVSGTAEVFPLSYNRPMSLKERYAENGELLSSELKTTDYSVKLLGVAGRFAGVLASQATFRDWLKAAHYNSMIEWRDELLKMFDQLQPKPGSEIENELDDLLVKIYSDKEVRSAGETDEEIDESRIKQQIKEEILRRREGTGKDEFNAKLRLAIDLVANLRDKRKLNMVAITPASIEKDGVYPIAGKFLRSFGGFFREEYSDYDFRVGKYVAARVLDSSIVDAKRLLKENVEHPPEPKILEPEPHFRSLEEEEKRKFENFLMQHVEHRISNPSFFKSLGARLLPFSSLKRRARNALLENLRGKLYSDIEGDVAYLYLRFENAGERRYLKGTTGSDVHVDDNGVIETIVGIRRQREGGTRYLLTCPQLRAKALEDRKFEYYFDFYRKTRNPLGSDDKRGSVEFKGDLKDWYDAAFCSSVPAVVVDMNGEDRSEPITHNQLQPEWIHKIE